MLAIEVDTPARLAFIRKVYALFSMAVCIFAGTAYFATSEAGLELVAPLYGAGFIGPIIIMAGMFILLRMTASRFPLNIIALVAFAVVEGLLTGPLLYLVSSVGKSHVIGQAALMTGVTFGGLTLFTLTSKKDFSFMRTGLFAGFFILLGLGLASWIFGFEMNATLMSLGWVVLMAGFLVYDTSNIMRHYPTHMAAAAAAMIFYDVVIMFKHLVLLLANRD